MTDIKFLKDRIIIDGHADTRKECETITLLCDNLAKSKDFKTVRYESGYAEFEKVGKAKELKFAAAIGHVTFVFDSTVVSVTNNKGTITASGENLITYDTQEDSCTFVVVLQDGYEIDTAVLVNDDSEANGTIDHYTSNTIYGDAGYGGLNGTITITTKQSGTTPTKQQIDLSTLSGWANLSNGNHSITVKAKGVYYMDSEASNAVTVTKGVSGGYTVNFSNNLGESPSTSGKVEYTLDGSTWNTVLEWSNWDGNQQPLQVTSLSNVSTIKFRLTMAEGEPSTLILTGIVAGSTTKVFEIETNFSTTTVSTDMLTLTNDINVSITNGDTAPGSGYTVSYTNKGAAQAPCKIKINGGDWVTITESSGSFQNVEKIQFYLTLANSYACTVKSTQLGLNLSANSVTTTNEYAIQENVTDIIIGFEPEMTGM